MASRNENLAIENVAYRVEYADISFMTERKAEKVFGEVSNVPVDPNERFQKNETIAANPDSEPVNESSTKNQQETLLFRRMMYLMSFLLVLILLISVASLALSLRRLNSSLGTFVRLL